jgi:DNA modification methylase
LTDTEYCLYFRNGSNQLHPNSYEDAQTFWFAPINQVDKNKYKHPTIKPLNMIEKLVRNSSNEGDLVFDPFLGSGTTGVACKNLNRNFIGTEISEEYFKIAQDRLNEDKQHIEGFFE